MQFFSNKSLKIFNYFSLFVFLVLAHATATANIYDKGNIGAKLGAAKSSEVKFTKGQTSLTDADKRKIDQAIKGVKSDGDVALVRILAWADSEYPRTGQRAPNSEVKLAEGRANAVSEYVKNNFSAEDVETYNMAERPTTVEEWMNLADAEVKNTITKPATTADKSEQRVKVDMGNRASSVLVLVYKDEPKKEM